MSGASQEDSTRHYRHFLHNFLRSNAVRSVVDLGCGDWEFSRHLDWKGIAYLGIDASKAALERARKFAAPGIEFRELNAVTAPLPAADALIVKDVLQHWSEPDILALVPKLPAYRYVLFTHGFQVNLRREPFNLPGAYVFWYQAEEPKFTFLCTNPATGTR